MWVRWNSQFISSRSNDLAAVGGEEKNSKPFCCNHWVHAKRKFKVAAVRWSEISCMEPSFVNTKFGSLKSKSVL